MRQFPYFFCVTVLVMQNNTTGSNPRAFIKKYGDTGLDMLRDNLAQDEIEFVLLKVLGQDISGSSKGTRNKFVFASWTGPSATRSKKASSLQLKSALMKYFAGHSLALEIFTPEDLNAADIESRLRGSGGAFQVSHYEYGTGNTIDQFSANSPPSPFSKSANAHHEQQHQGVDDSAVAKPSVAAARRESAAGEVVVSNRARGHTFRCINRGIVILLRILC